MRVPVPSGRAAPLIMAQQLRPASMLCILLLLSAASAQDADLFGAPKKSNFEALRDKFTKVGATCPAERDLHRDPTPPPGAR